MVGFPDPLQLIPENDWHKIQEKFSANWSNGRVVYYTIETQKGYSNRLPGFSFRVYCPYGDVQKGVVVINDKVVSYEVMIDCINDDTAILEEALKTTKVIDRRRNIVITFAREHILGRVKALYEYFDQNVIEFVHIKGFLIAKDTLPFKDVDLPPDVTFGFVAKEHIPAVDVTWPHRYPGSEKYFEFLIENKSGYGLFYKEEIVCWLWISDMGWLTHLYTPKDYRKKGYAELLTKLVANELLKKNYDVFDFVVDKNVAAMKLHHKLGFKRTTDYTWCFFESKLT